MKELTRSNIQLFGAWSAIIYMALVTIGWGLLAGFLLPPYQPSFDANQVAGLIQANAFGIRAGMVLLMAAAAFALPFSATAARLVARVEGEAGVLTYTTLLGGAALMVFTFYPAIWWLLAAYRSDRAPDLIALLNDGGWFQFVAGVSIFLGLPFGLAMAAFCDDSECPVFPRWSGYANVWLMLLILPDQVIFFFHRGPFAWNGLFGLWIPLFATGAWLSMTFYLMRKSILRERQAVRKR